MEEKAASVVHVCPECGSPRVDVGVLHGSKAQCRSCGWSGDVEATAAFEVGDQGHVMAALIADFRKAFGATAVELGRVLVKYGFLDVRTVNGKPSMNSKQLARYLSAAANATMRALIVERDRMQRERDDARTHGS
jgi:ribosomal protein L37AE/L43A